MEFSRFHIHHSQQLITGQALARSGQLPQELCPTFPVRGNALPVSDLVKAYVGNKRRCGGLALRGGRTHSARAIDELLPRAARFTDEVIRVRLDSCFDAGGLFGAIAVATARRHCCGGALIDTRVKWNPREGDAEAVIERALADDSLAWQYPREGNRTVVFEDTREHRGDGSVHTLRRVPGIAERTIKRHGRHLLVPDYAVDGDPITLGAEAADTETVIAFSRHHVTDELFHGEIKTDLDHERLPSGTFATNDRVCSPAARVSACSSSALTARRSPPLNACIGNGRMCRERAIASHSAKFADAGYRRQRPARTGRDQGQRNLRIHFRGLLHDHAPLARKGA